MSKSNTNGRNQFAMLTIDDLVAQDHLVMMDAWYSLWSMKGLEGLVQVQNFGIV